MHPFSVLTLSIFVAGYITARWDLVTRLYELAIFAWDHGVVTRTAKGFAILSIFFFLFILPVERLAAREIALEYLRASNSDGEDHFEKTGYDNMVLGGGLTRIFWPLDIPRTGAPGVIVGWRNSEQDFFVLAILEDVDVGLGLPILVVMTNDQTDTVGFSQSRGVELALRTGTLYRNSHHSISRIFDICGRSAMHVLGRVNSPMTPNPSNNSYFHAYTNPHNQFPVVSCYGANDRTVQIIMFNRPHPTKMEYVALNPISLALDDKVEKLENVAQLIDTVDIEQEQERVRKSKLVQKMELHTVTRNGLSPKEASLPLILSQVNCSLELSRLLHSNINLVGTRAKRGLSVGETIVESASTIWENAIQGLSDLVTVWLYPIIRRMFIVGLICHRVVAEMILRVLEWRLRPDYAALKDISATAQQVDIRLQQFCYWPIQYLTLRKRKDDWQSMTNSHPDYIRFYNSLWLVANDVIIGIALGSYIIDNAALVAYGINTALTSYTVEGLRRMISWLMDWPAGLKLNNELTAFLGDLFLWVIEYWAGCVANLRPILPHIIYFIGFSSFAGASMPISMFSDLLSILTLHIYSFYTASARIYNWQLTIITSLFHLFRGKKRNVLRNRIDSCDYDLDQLLLGTILFTLLFFLLPTVVVFYLTFASARMVIISLKASLDTLLAFLNHFPLFALMLRIKDSRRLPGGIRFELQDPRTIRISIAAPTELPPVSYIYLKSVPLSFRAMFHQYFQLGHRLRKHYLSPGVILCLATGRFVPPIHRKNLYSLQYSMLPARRASIPEVWTWLTEEQPAVNANGKLTAAAVPRTFGSGMGRRAYH
ncbi:MAG: phosphatidylinositol N-acetylglucosaminyltransferase subunit gpi1 [Sclerophora amabilis]|nr:MAG: phosphatidylinositol N-acetylglucosaminyltransferase subunit gpi1 [Sclerophora amabilis]